MATNSIITFDIAVEYALLYATQPLMYKNFQTPRSMECDEDYEGSTTGISTILQLVN